MRVDRGLEDAVQAFVDDLGPVMDAVTLYVDGFDVESLRRDVAVEAQHLSAAFIDADGLQTDDELWAFITTFGPRTDSQLGRATPADVRQAGLVTGRRSFLDQVSPLFEILLDLDRKQGTRRSLQYYERAMRIGHTVASLDSHVSATELQAIEEYRELLLDRLDDAGVWQPGRRPRSGNSTTARPPAAGGGTATAGSGRAGATAGPTPTDRDSDADTSRDTAETDPDAAEDEVNEEPPRPLEEVLADLDRLIGLEGVKQEVKLVANLIQVQNLRRERGLPVLEQSRHLVFVGNPGTGKTTVARLLAQIYRTLRVVERGHLVETDRSALVAGFVGQTASRVVEVFDRADQGVLLIDEAYALARGSEQDFGREAIDTIVKLVEDRRSSLVVIAAGYPAEMEDFIGANPGLRSRFPKTIHFPDYTTDELVQIFGLLGEDGRYHCTPEATAKVRRWFESQPRTKGFGNGRLARNLFEVAVANHATRVVDDPDVSDDELVTLQPEDIPDPTDPVGPAQPVEPAAPAGTTGEPAPAALPRSTP